MKINHIYHGHILDQIKHIDSESVDCCVTSPPYWNMRDYGEETIAIWDGDPNCKHQWGQDMKVKIDMTSANPDFDRKWRDQNISVSSSNFCESCGAWKGKLGMELHPDFYINHILQIVSEIKRILKKTGTFWLNMGDTYGTRSGSILEGKPGKFYLRKKGDESVYNVPQPQINMHKCLLMIPQRIAISLIQDGWILRNQIIWYKKNSMPESVKDRFVVDYEPIFLFVKSAKYNFTQLLEPYTKPLDRWGGDSLKADGHSDFDEATGQVRYRDRNIRPNSDGRNMRSVWEINTRPFPGAHFAVYPEEMIERIIKAGCPESGIVFDPFMGSGTTAITAQKLGCSYIGIEMNQSYLDMANSLLKGVTSPII